MTLSDLLQHIYVIHFEPLVERKIHLDDLLRRIADVKVSYRIMNEETDEVAKLEYNSKFLSSPRREKITPQELAVSLAHLEVYRDIVRKGYETCLILEDDAVLNDFFFDNIRSALVESKEFDFTFLSSCCNLHAPRTRTGLLQESSTSRSVCGYIVRSNCLEKVIKACEPFIDVIDWQLNHIRQELNLRYAWSEPEIVIQGSEKEFESNMHKVRSKR